MNVRDTAIAELAAALSQDPDPSAEAYLALGRQLYLSGRHAEGLRWIGEALARHPQDPALWNLQGASLRALKQPEPALAALDRAIALDARQTSARVHRGGALADLGRMAEARAELRQAVALKPDLIEAWLLLAGLAEGDALAVLDEGLAANPQAPRLAEGKVLALRRAGRAAQAQADLETLAERWPDQAWIFFHLGDLLAEQDRARGLALLRRAYGLEPSLHHMTLLAQTLARVAGADEGVALEEAYGLARRALDIGGLNPGHLKILSEVFARVCAFEEIARLGDFRTVGRTWAQSGRHSALMRQMPLVRSLEDRRELLEQHHIWGREIEATAAAQPIRKPPERPADGRIRLGFLSSDLRRHPVGYFAQPLFDRVDRARFDLYAYAFDRTPQDPLQARIEGQVTAFRRMAGASAHDAAQVIADDRLDMLIELGGTTQMNKVEAMAWRPAPRQASWLGYPHSVGLEAIDYFICDPYSVPPDRSLLLETPLLMPSSWIAVGGMAFTDDHAVEALPPQDRNGAITFGTANNTHKCNPETLRAWARATAAVPGARFSFIRPEGASETFRRHVLAAFAAEGVGEDRVIFLAVRGAHMPLYNQIDISLDTFPLTGGTTTVEALWMGVPVVTLRGPAFYERLSSSILANAGLGELVADNLEDFQRIALALAADKPRRAALRQGLREQVRKSPLGRTEDFARDFYDLIATAVTGA